MVAPFWLLMRLELDHSRFGSSFSLAQFVDFQWLGRHGGHCLFWGLVSPTLYPPFPFCGLLGSPCSERCVGLHASVFFQSATFFCFSLSVFCFLGCRTAHRHPVVHPPVDPDRTMRSGGPILSGGAWWPFLLFLGFAQSSVTCYHGRAILASDAT